MIVYFADRKLNILGQASTTLPKGLMVTDDTKDEDVESGVAVFECEFGFDANTRATVEACAEVGNYILRKNGDENEFYTIIDSEIDTKKQTAFIYAEDAGLDLLNEVVGAYEADKAYPIDYYVEKFAYDSGFVIGINEAAGLTRQLKWDGEDTVTARLASVATQFDGCEVSFSFDIERMRITSKKINIFKKRGKDIGTTLRLNKEIDNIVIKKTIVNVATALRCSGGTPAKSSEILEVWSDAGSPRVLYGVTVETLGRTETSVNITAKVTAALGSEDSTLGKGYILTASIYMGSRWYDAIIKETDKEWKGTTNHAKEFTFTVSGLSAAAITFSDIKFKVTRSDSKGGSAGVLSEKKCGTHIVSNYIKGGENGEAITERPMTLEGYMYDDGDFYVDGDTLKCRSAVQKWSRYINPTEQNLEKGQEGHIVRLFSYDTTSQAELCAQTITALKKVIDAEVNYEADILYLPENTKIGDRVNIVDEAGELFLSTRLLQMQSSVVRQEQKATLGEFLIKKSGISEKVMALADQFAIEAATNRKAREEAARKAAEAEREAREAAEKAAKAEADLEAAQEAAEEAQRIADEAQAQADAAAKAAAEAKAEAAEANASVEIAQSNAQTATAKAEEAKSAADTAKADAEDAKTTAMAAKLDAEQAKQDILSLGENLETVKTTMQADYARKTDLTEAEASLQSQISQNAAQISSTVSRMETIDETANNAKEQAESAQSAAATAKATADQAKADATAAQNAANSASTAASNAQSKADAAKTAADAAQKAADDADAKAAQAETDLASAKQNLANVTSRVDATEEEISEAKAAVVTAQAAADKAKADAATAQSTADTAKANAATAQTAANNAKTAADNAQAAADDAQQAADDAQQAADDAQAAVDALAVRVTTAETQITQNSEQIALSATKKELQDVNNSMISVSESVASLDVKADGIMASVAANKSSVDNAIEAANGNIDALRNEVAAKMTEEAVEIQIKSAMENGVQKVVTETGFKFDGDGLTVEKAGTEMKTQITEDGMTVYKNEEAVLTANNVGVAAKNLRATTYLIVGKYSRFEDYGSDRTGCFWIGG